MNSASGVGVRTGELKVNPENTSQVLKTTNVFSYEPWLSLFYANLLKKGNLSLLEYYRKNQGYLIEWLY